jgi:tRNA(Ile)-lysidine synthase
MKLSTTLQTKLQSLMPTNIETVLRMARLQLFRDAVKQDSLEYILTGHHEDDQYETVLQRLAWGSGMAGLAGIPVRNGHLLRPLLSFSKVILYFD